MGGGGNLRCVGAVIGGGSQRKPAEGSHCALILRRYSLQSWEKGKAASEGPPSLQESVPSCVRLCEDLGFIGLRPTEEMVLWRTSTRSNRHPASCQAGVTRPVWGARESQSSGTHCTRIWFPGGRS